MKYDYLLVGNDDGSDFGTTAIFCQSGKPLIKNNSIVNISLYTLHFSFAVKFYIYQKKH